MSNAPRYSLIPILSLSGVILDALGGLYLAYDLLGGKNGPLRTLTKSVSYGVMFGAAYGLPLGVWFGLAGLLISGPALSIEIGRRSLSDVHPFDKALTHGVLRALSFGAAGWLSLDPWFGINFGIFSAAALVSTYALLGPPVVVSSRRPRLDKGVLKRAAFRGGSLGLAAVLSGLIHRESHALAYGVKVGMVTGMSSAILVAVSPAVEAWVDNLPDRRLGGYGAILVLIGSLFQTLQYVFPMAHVLM
jgi:hypothetical protein